MKTHLWNADNRDGTYSNPVLYTDYSDPDAIRVGQDYYLVASSFCNTPGIPVLHSHDLVNWELINYVLEKLPEERYQRPIHGCGVWAPSIRYHDGVYYVCFPMPDEGIFMSMTEEPRGSWTAPKNICPGAGRIDPCPFWDEDGKAYLVSGVAKSRIGYKSVLHVQEMRPDGLGTAGEPVIVFDGNICGQETIEGPKLYKRNGWYYIFAPAGGVKTGWQTVLRSRSVYGPYEYRVVMRQGKSIVNGPHQGAWVDTVAGEDWFLHFQDIGAAGRILHLQPMKWQDDWPVIGHPVNGEHWGEPVEQYRKPNIGNTITKCIEPDTSDCFPNGKPGLQWQWNANPRASWLMPSDSGLILRAVKKDGAYSDVPNLLLQKWPAPEFSCVTEMDLSALTPGDEAGVISLGMEYGAVIFRCEKKRFLVRTVYGKQHFGPILVESTNERTEEIGMLSADTQTIWIRYTVKKAETNWDGDAYAETVNIGYSIDGAEYIFAMSIKAEPGRWVGVKNGVFCLSDRAGSTGQTMVRSVSYHRLYRNPVMRGFFPDPSIIRSGCDYYMVNSSFQYFPAIPISHSTDLIHWEVIGHAVTDPEELDLSDIRDSHGIWAPDIAFDGEKYIIMATLRLNGDGKRGNNVLRRQLVVTAKKPEGPWSKPAWLEVDNIDPSLFTDVDGKHYMVISPGINLVPLSQDCRRVTGKMIRVWAGTGERCPEGPHLIRHGRYYYAILAEGGTGYDHGINAARSRNLFGPYEPSPYNPLLRQFDSDAPLQRCGHGKLVEDSNGDWWIVYLCGRANGGHYTTIGRETALEPVDWTEDGWFIINKRNGPSQMNDAPDLPEFRVQEWTMDDFDSDTLNPTWQFVRRPSGGNWSLEERKGWLRIWTQDGTLNEIRAKNILLRREEELSYNAETKLEFDPKKDGEQAGLTCYYSTVTYVRLSVCQENGRRLQLVINRNHGEELVASVDDLPEGPIWLQVEVRGLVRRFSWSVDGVNWMLAGELKNCTYLSDEGVPDDPKRHTGTLVGLYASNGGCGSRIPADFDYFKYHNIMK